MASVLEAAPVSARWQLLPGNVRHTFTHFNLEIRVAIAATTRKISGHWVALDKIQGEALPSVMHKIIRHALKQGAAIS